MRCNSILLNTCITMKLSSVGSIDPTLHIFSPHYVVLYLTCYSFLAYKMNQNAVQKHPPNEQSKYRPG